MPSSRLTRSWCWHFSASASILLRPPPEPCRSLFRVCFPLAVGRPVFLAALTPDGSARHLEIGRTLISSIVNAVILGVGLITVLSVRSLAEHAFFWIPAVIACSFIFALPIAWFVGRNFHALCRRHSWNLQSHRRCAGCGVWRC